MSPILPHRSQGLIPLTPQKVQSATTFPTTLFVYLLPGLLLTGKNHIMELPLIADSPEHKLAGFILPGEG